MLRLPLLLLILSMSSLTSAEDIRISASTVYLDPDANGARVSKERGVTQWTDPATAVLWFGQLQSAGSLNASVVLKAPQGAELSLKLIVGRQSQSVQITGAGDGEVRAVFGEFSVSKPGYVSFRLESLNQQGQSHGDVKALVLSGPATINAHFNMLPRRNAASVHLAYPVDRDTEVSAFYCEMTGVEDPLWTYYMACGWHRGYFGMQVNSPTERRIIFSVWDSGGEAVSRDNVGGQNRVQLLAKGDGVFSGDFGNEGTGGHSHLKYRWKAGAKQKFLVTAEPVSETHTVYAGYYFHPDSKKWMLISSWKAPKEGRYMRGLYSFSENFIGRNGHVVRRALYGNQWLRTSAGEWREMTTAKFSHDQTGKADRLDRFMGLDDGRFFLSHGGFVEGYTKAGQPFTREPSGHSPANMDLPPLPAAK